MQAKKYLIPLAVLTAVLILPTVASAGPGRIQEHGVIATETVGRWESKHVGRGAVELRVGPVRLRQTTYHHCLTTYGGHGVFVQARIPSCTAPGGHPMVFRYVSVAGPQGLQITIWKPGFQPYQGG